MDVCNKIRDQEKLIDYKRLYLKGDNGKEYDFNTFFIFTRVIKKNLLRRYFTSSSTKKSRWS